MYKVSSIQFSHKILHDYDTLLLYKRGVTIYTCTFLMTSTNSVALIRSTGFTFMHWCITSIRSSDQVMFIFGICPRITCFLMSSKDWSAYGSFPVRQVHIRIPKENTSHFSTSFPAISGIVMSSELVLMDFQTSGATYGEVPAGNGRSFDNREQPKSISLTERVFSQTITFSALMSRCTTFRWWILWMASAKFRNISFVKSMSLWNSPL